MDQLKEAVNEYVEYWNDKENLRCPSHLEHEIFEKAVTYILGHDENSSKKFWGWVGEKQDEKGL